MPNINQSILCIFDQFDVRPMVIIINSITSIFVSILNDLLINYSLSKMSGTASQDIHRYLQMIVNIQMMIDGAIATSKDCTAFYGCSEQLKDNVFEELNTYIDDATEWNKL